MVTDIDECSENSNICGKNMICNNEMGSYKCECMPGFEPKLNGSVKICVDKNECESNVNNTCPSETSQCINTIGSFQCKCKEGHDGDGHNCTPTCDNCYDGECLAPNVCVSLLYSLF